MINLFSCNQFNRSLKVLISTADHAKSHTGICSAAGKASDSDTSHRKSSCVTPHKGLLNCIWNDAICKWTYDSLFHYSSNASVKKGLSTKNNQVFGTCSIRTAIINNLFERIESCLETFFQKFLNTHMKFEAFFALDLALMLFDSLKLIGPLERAVQQSSWRKPGIILTDSGTRWSEVQDNTGLM